VQPLYDQQKLWTTKWGSGYAKKVNAYAKRCLAEIKKRDTLHSLLDLGCGAGQDAAFFASHELEVTAADFTEAALRFIPKNTPHLPQFCLT
jgi:2-polyprenyl-3-methyl-5-hydroxy-6-metoxy-1,4-benzoquinol methylase